MCAATSRTRNDVDLVEEAEQAPRGAAARDLPACDLVMKGGITSGVVYPGRRDRSGEVVPLRGSWRNAGRSDRGRRLCGGGVRSLRTADETHLTSPCTPRAAARHTGR